LIPRRSSQVPPGFQAFLASLPLLLHAFFPFRGTRGEAAPFSHRRFWCGRALSSSFSMFDHLFVRTGHPSPFPPTPPPPCPSKLRPLPESFFLVWSPFTIPSVQGEGPCCSRGAYFSLVMLLCDSLYSVRFLSSKLLPKGAFFFFV